MRIKFLPTHSKQSYTVNYLFQKEEKSREEAFKDNFNKTLKCQRILSNLDNDTRDSWIHVTKNYCEIRSNKTGFDLDWNKNVMHLVVSIHPEDSEKLANVWSEIVAKVHQELKIGSDENNSIAWLHRDVDHHHVHLLFSKMSYKGEKFDDSNIGRRLNDLANKFDKEFDLTPGSGNKNNPERGKPQKNNLRKQLYSASKNSRTFSDFVDKLSANGIRLTVETKYDHPQIVYHDIKNERDYHESSLPNQYAFRNISNLDRSTKKNEFNYSEQKKFIQSTISKCLNKSTTEDQFEEYLKDYGVQLIKHSNNSGAVFGYSFQQINLQESYTFKASQVGFSYKKIQYYLYKNQEGALVSPKLSSEFKQPIQSIESNYQQPILSGPMNSSQEDEDITKKKRKRKKKDRNI